MTIEEHIKKAMEECPLTKQQEDKLLLGLENYLNEIEQLKNLNTPVVGRSFSFEKVQEIALDVMNLGMSLRQDQLAGRTDKSGNEVLKEYMDGL